MVLVRHGEAVCNVSGVIGGYTGCTGLTDRGVTQATALRDRLTRTGELARRPRCTPRSFLARCETAEIIRPALEAWREGPLDVVALDELCELHPGKADGLTWAEFTARYPVPDWDNDPDEPVVPGAESWTGFVERASTRSAPLPTRTVAGSWWPPVMRESSRPACSVSSRRTSIARAFGFEHSTRR